MFDNIGFPTVLLLFLVFCAWLKYELRKATNGHTVTDDFWEKEERANKTPAKSLSALKYITIPEDKLPFGCLPDHKEVEHMEYTIHSLAKPGRKIVNLTGITNTDLKLEYGAANLGRLTEYDSSYITLVTTLQDWADVLISEGMYEEASSILEFAVSTGTDISDTYRKLCDIWKNHMSLSSEEARDKINTLLPVAENLNSMSKDTIIQMLRDEAKAC